MLSKRLNQKVGIENNNETKVVIKGLQIEVVEKIKKKIKKQL